MSTRARPRRERGELGAVALEYVVAGLALIGLVGVVGTATEPGQRLMQAAGYNICQAASVVTGASCEQPPGGGNASGEPLRPGDPGYNGMTPEEQATGGDYVALGDSYSSGEGASDYVGDTDDNNSFGFWADDYENMCHRSANAYSAGVSDAYGFGDRYHFGACSGAVANDYFDPIEDGADNRDGQGAQQDYVRGNAPSLVSMSMGGNDFGFGDALGSCITSDCFENDGEVEGKQQEIYERIWGVPWDDDADVRAANEREALSIPRDESLLALYAALREDAGPDARLLIVGYPRLFPEGETTAIPWNYITRSERRRINTLGGFVNSELERAVAASPGALEYVDVTEALKGHELTTDDPWINDLNLGRGGPAVFSQESFHPNEEGNAAIAAIVNQHIREGRR